MHNSQLRERVFYRNDANGKPILLENVEDYYAYVKELPHLCFRASEFINGVEAEINKPLQPPLPDYVKSLPSWRKVQQFIDFAEIKKEGKSKKDWGERSMYHYCVACGELKSSRYVYKTKHIDYIFLNNIFQDNNGDNVRFFLFPLFFFVVGLS